MSQEEVIRAAHVVIRFDGQRCIHSRHCVLDRPDVFVPNVKGAWIHPENATVAEALELAHNCPSGAIRCEAPDGAAIEAPPRVNTVRLRENGPLALHAPLSVGGQAQGYRLTLCPAAVRRRTSRTATAATRRRVLSPAAKRRVPSRSRWRNATGR